MVPGTVVSIINVSSKACMSRNPNMFAYASGKWAVRSMSQLAAIDYAPFGIRVNVIFPASSIRQCSERTI
jgi:3alpha(or 20beta)-hydroxysteroid dehydrogenase